jgi:general secretion pathway protein K
MTVRRAWRHLLRRFGATSAERGFALLIVVWGLGVLSLIALSFAVTVNSHTKAAANIIESVKVQAAADGGVLLAALKLGRLSGQPSSQPPEPDGTILHVVCRTPDGVALTITAEDEGGKIDLNAADDRLLQRLFVHFGASQDQAAALVDAVVDYRDSDSLRRIHGAEASEYQSAGLTPGPKNARFDSVEELEQVLGLPQHLYAAVRPYLTVYSRRTGIDPQYAPLPDLAAAAGLSPAQADSLATGRGLARQSVQIPSEFVAPSSRRAFRVTVVGRSEAGAVFVRVAILELTGAQERPFAVRDWQRGRVGDKKLESLNKTSISAVGGVICAL